MKRLPPLYVLAAAVLVVGGVFAFGVPTSSLWFLGLVVLCPLMMMVMMGSMRRSGGDDPGGDAQGSGDLPKERGSRSRLGR